VQAIYKSNYTTPLLWTQLVSHVIAKQMSFVFQFWHFRLEPENTSGLPIFRNPQQWLPLEIDSQFACFFLIWWAYQALFDWLLRHFAAAVGCCHLSVGMRMDCSGEAITIKLRFFLIHLDSYCCRTNVLIIDSVLSVDGSVGTSDTCCLTERELPHDCTSASRG
jgi:hypothetical protein